MDYCFKNKNKNHEIYIWKYDKELNIKGANSCSSCTILSKKYNYPIYTFDENMKRRSAIVNNPQVSLCYLIKN